MGKIFCKSKCCCFSCCNLKSRNSVGVLPNIKLKFLLLGLADSGKTEIGYFLTKSKRLDFDATNGVHNYQIAASSYDALLAESAECSLTEIGGSDDMQKIWHHYYAGTMGIVYCFDMSQNFDKLQISFNLLNEILKHSFVKGKSILLVATKSDLADDSLQLYDIENVFHLHQMAVETGSSIKLCYHQSPRPCQEQQAHEVQCIPLHYEHRHPEQRLHQQATTDKSTSTLKSGIEWLINYTLENYSALHMRINTDKNMQLWEQQRNKLIAEGKLKLHKYQRFPRPSNPNKIWRLPRRHFRGSLMRPRTAPSTLSCISFRDTSNTSSSLDLIEMPTTSDSSQTKASTSSANKVPNGILPSEITDEIE